MARDWPIGPQGGYGSSGFLATLDGSGDVIPGQLTVFNSSGQVVKTLRPENNKPGTPLSFSVSDLTPDLYLVRLTTPGGTLEQKLLVR